MNKVWVAAAMTIVSIAAMAGACVVIGCIATPRRYKGVV